MFERGEEFWEVFEEREDVHGPFAGHGCVADLLESALDGAEVGVGFLPFDLVSIYNLDDDFCYFAAKSQGFRSVSGYSGEHDDKRRECTF